MRCTAGNQSAPTAHLSIPTMPGSSRPLPSFSLSPHRYSAHPCCSFGARGAGERPPHDSPAEVPLAEGPVVVPKLGEGRAMPGNCDMQCSTHGVLCCCQEVRWGGPSQISARLLFEVSVRGQPEIVTSMSTESERSTALRGGTQGGVLWEVWHSNLCGVGSV